MNPGILEDLVGWFPVHPDLYYRIRIARSMSELATHPDNLELYDDVAVAYDRIGDDASAIKVIGRKRDMLIKQGIKEPPSKEPVDGNLFDLEIQKRSKDSSRDPWYRFYANVGTFRVHRWLRAGRLKEHRDWVDLAQKDIDRAIEINPYAHQLREFAQADVIRWLREGDSGQRLGDYMLAVSPQAVRSKALALAGLIELGGAWESVDVYEALALLQHGNLGHVAEERVYELQRAGKRSLIGRIFEPSDFIGYGGSKVLGPNTDAEYQMLRKATDEYRAYRIDYELTRLRGGHHPDSDPHFYEEFQERDFPSFGFELPGYLFWLFLESPICFVFPLVPVVLLVFRARRKRRAAKSASNVSR